jgi:hypothetical protein
MERWSSVNQRIEVQEISSTPSLQNCMSPLLQYSMPLLSLILCSPLAS